MKAKANSELEAEIQAIEKGIRDAKTKLKDLRRSLPPTEIHDYTFKNSYGQNIKLSEVFGNKDELILVHNMGIGCPYCTLWADGFNGVLKHLEERAAFVVESPDDYPVQRQFASDRGWNFKMLSSKGTEFRKDMGYADEKDSPQPGVSTFRKSSDSKITRIAHTGFGPGDNYCVLWDLFDLLPKFSGEPRIKYHYSTSK